VLSLTLIDGKVLNVLTGTKSMQTCPICHRNPKDFNVNANIEGRLFVSIKSALTFGISPLHAYIRIFEMCLQISYRLNIKIHHVRSKEDKLEFNSRKAYIQNQFWEKLSLRVSQPKPYGYGNTNTGNTARRAFKVIDVLLKITGLKSELLYKLKIIPHHPHPSNYPRKEIKDFLPKNLLEMKTKSRSQRC